MFQNKGENKSRLCYSLQNHYICIAKSKCDYGHEIEMYTVEQGEKRDKRQ